MDKTEPSNQEQELTAQEKMDNAIARSKLYGELGMTAQDHKDMGGTPGQELRDNWGRTQGELMTDEQILKWFTNTKKFIQETEQRLAQKKNRNDEYILKITKGNLEGGIRYLESIGRLSEELKK